jgi:hypothetical protein
MNLDLNDLLNDWPHEPGQIKVRKIIGSDGKEKLQLRIDLGLIQMEVTGRPDGQRPHGYESLLSYHQHRALEKQKRGGAFMLSAEELMDLQQEGIQYYHRYISMFQINDYLGVIRDTQRNLELFTFVTEHVENEEAAWPLEQFRPYVTMMNTRAKASIEIERDDYAAAVKHIEAGRDVIQEIYQRSGNVENASKSPELSFLEEWLEEVRAKRPLSKLEVMQREMEMAIASEAYERAAELRDQINAYAKKRAGE